MASGKISSVDRSNNKILTGTTPALNGTLTINFPDGFSADNSCITSLMYSDTNGTWRYVTYTPSLPAPLTCAFISNKVSLTTRDNVIASRPFKILLTKYT